MDASRQYILVYGPREFKVLNRRLEVMAEQQLSTDIEHGFVLDNEQIAVQTRGEILFYEMR